MGFSSSSQASFLSPTTVSTPIPPPFLHAVHWHVCHNWCCSQTFIHSIATCPSHPPWTSRISFFCLVLLADWSDISSLSLHSRVKDWTGSFDDEASQSITLIDLVAGFHHFETSPAPRLVELQCHWQQHLLRVLGEIPSARRVPFCHGYLPRSVCDFVPGAFAFSTFRRRYPQDPQWLLGRFSIDHFHWMITFTLGMIFHLSHCHRSSPHWSVWLALRSPGRWCAHIPRGTASTHSSIDRLTSCWRPWCKLLLLPQRPATRETLVHLRQTAISQAAPPSPLLTSLEAFEDGAQKFAFSLSTAHLMFLLDDASLQANFMPITSAWFPSSSSPSCFGGFSFSLSGSPCILPRLPFTSCIAPKLKPLPRPLPRILSNPLSSLPFRAFDPCLPAPVRLLPPCLESISLGALLL